MYTHGVCPSGTLFSLIAFCSSHHADQRPENHCACIQLWQDGVYRCKEVTNRGSQELNILYRAPVIAHTSYTV